MRITLKYKRSTRYKGVVSRERDRSDGLTKTSLEDGDAKLHSMYFNWGDLWISVTPTDEDGAEGTVNVRLTDSYGTYHHHMRWGNPKRR